jgi:hypothetical protein
VVVEQFLGPAGLGEAMGVSRHAVHKWRSRHPAGAAHPFPAPDVEVDGLCGWRASRLPEIRRWHDALPGRGTGGGRPAATHQDYLDAAAAAGLTPDEADRSLRTFAAEFPHLSTPQLHAWLAQKLGYRA